MNIYRYLDYRTAIAELIQHKRKENQDWTFTRLADALRIQKTYVSKVFKEDAHFNPDQLYLACRFLQLDAEETQYLFLLLEYNRSVVNERRRELQGQIHEIQSEHRNTRRHLKAKMVNPEQSEKYTAYYLDPMAPLVHNYLSIPEFSRNPDPIAQKLNLTKKQLRTLIALLEKLEIVAWDPGSKSYRILMDHLQLASDSPINLPYQILFRLQTAHHIKRLSPDERFNFSVTFTGNEKTRSTLHEEFLKFLRKAEGIVKEAPSEKVFQMNFDLFPWDSG